MAETDVPRASEGAPTFAAFLERLHRERYTGAVVVHCVHGVARTVEVPRPPVRIALTVESVST